MSVSGKTFIRTFETCHDIIKGKNRRLREVNLPLAGGLFRCAICGSALAGEQPRKKLAGGGVNEHVYYRCCNRHRPEGHPLVCWKSEMLEAAIVEELRKLKLPSAEITEWFRESLRSALKDESSFRKDLVAQIPRKETDLEAKKSRLLDALADHVEKGDYEKKADELRVELDRTRRQTSRNSP